MNFKWCATRTDGFGRLMEWINGRKLRKIMKIVVFKRFPPKFDWPIRWILQITNIRFHDVDDDNSDKNCVLDVNNVRIPTYINRKNLPVCYTDLKTKINRILTPPQSYRPRSYMQLVNTRILRPFWSKSVEKPQCYRRKTLKNVKYRVFFEFLRPPDTPKKLWASKLHVAC